VPRRSPPAAPHLYM